jgi:hypothetical protein
VRTSTGRGFAPGCANVGRRGSVVGARASEERPGRVFIGAGGQLGGGGVNHVTGTRAASAARHDDVRQSGRCRCFRPATYQGEYPR